MKDYKKPWVFDIIFRTLVIYYGFYLNMHGNISGRTIRLKFGDQIEIYIFLFYHVWLTPFVAYINFGALSTVQAMRDALL